VSENSDYADLFVAEDAPDELPPAEEQPAIEPAPETRQLPAPPDPWTIRELEPGKTLDFPKVMAFLERTAAGDLVVQTQCQVCKKPRTLPCRDPEGGLVAPEIWPNRPAMQYADMIICPDCTVRLERVRAERQAAREEQREAKRAAAAAAKRRKRQERTEARKREDAVDAVAVEESADEAPF
jgi:hypothetical protein